MKQWFIEVRCWFLFRHHMERVGDPMGNKVRAQMWQCAICAKTISVNQSNMSWL